MDEDAQYFGTSEENLTAAVGVVVLDADRVEFRAFCAGGGVCGPAVAESVTVVADAAGSTAAATAGRREQDPAAVLAAVRRCVDCAVAAGGWVTGAQAKTMAARVLAVAVVERHRGRGGSVVAWNRCTGAPLCNAILWSADGGQCRRRPRRRRRRGSRAPRDQPSSVAFTIQWLLDNDATVRAANSHGGCYFGTIGNWIVWNLTGGVNGGVFATDPSTSALFTPLTVNSPPEWDVKQLAISGISPESLPEIKSAYALYGFIRDGPLRETPISGVVGNQQFYQLPTGDNGTRLINALERLTASVKNFMMESVSAATVEIEGNHCCLYSKVPPARCVPTTPTRLSDDKPRRCVSVNVENRVVIEDNDDEVLPTSMSVPIADVSETANTSVDEPRHDDDLLGAADNGIASEEHKPIDRKWLIGAATVAVVGVGALLVFGGYKMLTHK